MSKRSKIHIDIRDDIDHITAIERVLEVIKLGRISKNETSYCYLTSFSDNICVAVNDYRKSDCFIVYKNEKPT